MKKRLTILYGICLLLVSACQKESTDGNLLDVELNAALFNASDGEGRKYFKLPESHQLNQIPQDPNNSLNPAKVELGKMLFHETGLGVTPNDAVSIMTYSCASCHFAGAGFQAGVPQGIGEGGIGFGINGEGRFHNPDYAPTDMDVQPLRTPTAMNGAYQKNVLWNGQFGATGVNTGLSDLWAGLEGTDSPLLVNSKGFEGLETQAIAGMGVHRMDCTPEMVESSGYKSMFDAAFPNIPAPERYELEQAGLAIAAYERTLLANKAPFQQWLRGDDKAMSKAEKRGAVVFFERANCVKCHTGPALNSMEFHALGMEDLDGPQVTNYDPTNSAHKGRGGFTKDTKDDYAFKVPQLYNLIDSPFYGHGASFESIREIVEYKNTGQAENTNVTNAQLSDEFKPLHLSQQEIDDLTLFLERSLRDPDLKRYEPTALPTGNCFPNADETSKVDLGCE